MVEVKRLTLTEIEEIAERIAKTITEENKLSKAVQKIIEVETIKASQEVFHKYYDEIPYKPKREVEVEEYRMEYRRKLYNIYREAERLVQQMRIREAIANTNQAITVLKTLSNRIALLELELRRQRSVLEEAYDNSKIIYSYSVRRKRA